MPLLYSVISELVIELGGEQAGQQQAQFESMIPLYTQGVTLPAIIGAFGDRLGFVDYGLEETTEQQLYGIVWDLNDSAVFTQLMNALKPFTAGMPFMEMVEEQGIPGMRFNSPDPEMEITPAYLCTHNISSSASAQHHRARTRSSE